MKPFDKFVVESGAPIGLAIIVENQVGYRGFWWILWGAITIAGYFLIRGFVNGGSK